MSKLGTAKDWLTYGHNLLDALPTPLTLGVPGLSHGLVAAKSLLGTVIRAIDIWGEDELKELLEDLAQHPAKKADLTATAAEMKRIIADRKAGR